jgi:hypothetical protein
MSCPGCAKDPVKTKELDKNLKWILDLQKVKIEGTDEILYYQQAEQTISNIILSRKQT